MKTRKKSFSQKVLAIVKRIPKGRVTTYSNIARMLGNPNSQRAVGNALKNNPTPIKVPCHRVIRNNGNLGGYSRGRKKKERLLKKEGIEIKKGKIDLKKYIWKG